VIRCQPSYAVIASDTVMVTAKTAAAAGYGTTLHALSAVDGSERWSKDLGGTYWWSGLATQGGVVFALSYDGVLRAFDIGNGTQLWQQQLPQYSYSAPPTVRDGVVYAHGAGSGGTLSAVDASTGRINWNVEAAGSIDAPSVDDTGIYVTHVCDATRISLDGSRVWTIPSGCTGGGGKHATLDSARSRFYVRNYGSPRGTFIADTETGAVGQSVPYGSPYAIYGDAAFTVDNGVLVNVNPQTGLQRWSMGGDPNDELVGTPIVVNGTVIVGGESGTIYGISASSGARVLTVDAGSPIADLDEQNVSQPPAGSAVGQGLVTLTTVDGIVALSS
jgi:outer membrane protein assembly factor BamB